MAAVIERALRGAANIGAFSKRITKQSKGAIVRLCERVLTFLAGSKDEVPGLLDAVEKRMKVDRPSKNRLAYLEKCGAAVDSIVTRPP